MVLVYSRRRMCLLVGHWKYKNAKCCQEDIYIYCIDTHDMCTFNLNNETLSQ